MSQPAKKDSQVDRGTAPAIDLSTFAPLGDDPHVRKVFAIQQGWSVSVWTVMDSFDRDIRDQVYDVESSFFPRFPKFELDFNVIEGDETTTVPEAKLVYSKI